MLALILGEKRFDKIPHEFALFSSLFWESTGLAGRCRSREQRGRIGLSSISYFCYCAGLLSKALKFTVCI
jgi:hypothetical protein